MNRMLCLSAVTGSACLVALLGCQSNNQDISAGPSNPGGLPRHTPPADTKINATTLFAHAHLLERQGAFERAVIQYQKALLEKPDFMTARNRLGITLNKLGRHMEASEQFEICLETQPSLAYLHNNLGFSRYLEGQYELAEVHLKQALQLDPEFSRARMNHAVVLSKLGRQQDAYNELTQIGTKADACFNMGILLTEAGQFDSAAQYLEAALAANPKFEAARKQLHEVARLAAEHEARVATEIYAQQPVTSSPQVVSTTANQPAPLANQNSQSELNQSIDYSNNNSTAYNSGSSVEIEEVPVSSSQQPRPQPTVASNSSSNTSIRSNSSNIYGNNQPQQSSSFATNQASVGQSNSFANNASSNSNDFNSTNSTSNVEVESAPATASAEPLQDPMSVTDTNGRSTSTPQPSPSGSIETIYVGSTPVANNTGSVAPSNSTPVAGNPQPAGSSSNVTIESVPGSVNSTSNAPVVSSAASTPSQTWTPDPVANVDEGDPQCSEDDQNYTIIETIDMNQTPNSSNNTNGKVTEQVQPVADETPMPAAPQQPVTNSAAIIVEPVTPVQGD